MKNNKAIMSIGFLALVLLLYLPRLLQYNFYFAHVYLALFTGLAILPILLYNGKQGLKTKYLLYAFYPLHLTLIGVLAML